jgi:diguanylate cyclase (GGDEF)-like protein
VIDKDLEISKEPLWAIPGPIQERLQASLKDREYAHFLLCGLYSAVAIVFLVLFGLAALYRGEIAYASVIFGFAVVTFVIYTIAWYSRRYEFTRHFLTLLMATLCLYLFYTGGTDNTGPLYYFVFPLVAVFLQGFNFGLASVIALLVSTWILDAGAFGFDVERYSTTFVIRVTAVYLIVAALAFLFEYFRVKAERELLLSIDDLNQLTYGDINTNLANRRLMEKLLVSEVNRGHRYPLDFCILFIEPDYLKVQTARYGSMYAHEVRTALAAMLTNNLRLQDVPGIWDDSRFMVLLPHTPLEGAMALAARLLTECEQQQFTLHGQSMKFTISVGMASLQDQGVDELIEQATRNLQQARRDGGNRLAAA